MSITIDQIQGLGEHGKVVTDSGDRVGSIGQVYLDDATGAPTWVTVRTGLFGSAETFVPVEGARLDGHDVVVPYTKDLVKAAPRVDADGSLSPQEEDTLYRHYGLGAGDVTTGAADHRDTTGPAERTVGHDTSGPTTDDAMTRSEERLKVSTQVREAGRARLRKYVVTEHVTQTVPVRHEEVRLVREPITDANRGAATSGPAISEEEHEVVLHAEVPVVEKTVVAVERIQVGTTTVTENQTVSADVRKEQIELDDPTAVKPTGTSTGPSTGAGTGTGKVKNKGNKNRR